MMRIQRVIVLGLLGSAQPASATEPLIYGARAGFPLVSPPGWFGPGPAGHRGAPGFYDWNYYGVANGPFVQPGLAGWGHGFGPGFFGIPGAAGSFWTNGMSLYGPPIPTYAPQPGVFGNADLSRAYHSDAPVVPALGAGFGAVFPGNKRHRLQPPLGWAGQFAPSPRHLPLSVSVHPPVAVVPGPPAVTVDGSPCVRLTVCVPASTANVWIQDTPTTVEGTEREFISPPMEPGKQYRYSLVARWFDANGKERAETRELTATAGQTLRVQFGEEAAPDAAPEPFIVPPPPK